jgi:hypothetical protein
MKKIYRNLILIRFELFKRVMLIWSSFLVFMAFFEKNDWIFSSMIGVTGSFFIFNQLLLSQSLILQKRNKGIFFIHYIVRLIIYSVPIGMFFFFQNYLNFPVLLISLFSFQVLYIVLELTKNYSKYRKRIKHG